MVLHSGALYANTKTVAVLEELGVVEAEAEGAREVEVVVVGEET